MRSITKPVTGLGGLLLSASCAAGSLSGAFNVVITLAPGQGMCVSETLNARTRVTVQVTCRSGLFVDISTPIGFARNGQEQIYRLPFGPGLYPGDDDSALDGALDAGIITGLRIDQRDEGIGPLTMLVTF
ncbi:MAG: hypothetical protein ABI905_08835 [Betaproteobacteria bacterium]